MADLEARIERLKGAQAPPPKREEHYSQANLAWRMVIELVAGLAIGFGVGYGLDVLLGTMPLFLITFVFLGLAAGIRTMMRTAKEIGAGQETDHPGETPAEKDEERGD